MRLITQKQLPDKGITYTPEHIARLEKAGKFPKAVWLSTKRKAWVEAEVDDWIAALVSQRDAA